MKPNSDEREFSKWLKGNHNRDGVLDIWPLISINSSASNVKTFQLTRTCLTTFPNNLKFVKNTLLCILHYFKLSSHCFKLWSNTSLSVKERKVDDWEKEKSESWRQAVSKLSQVFHSMTLRYYKEKQLVWMCAVYSELSHASIILF